MESLSENEMKALTDKTGRAAERYYRDLLSTAQTDPMSEMTAREFTEQMIREILEAKSEKLLP